MKNIVNNILVIDLFAPIGYYIMSPDNATLKNDFYLINTWSKRVKEGHFYLTTGSKIMSHYVIVDSPKPLVTSMSYLCNLHCNRR